MQIITHQKHTRNISPAERWFSALAGGFLAVTGMKKGSIGGGALALLGGELVRRSITGHCYLYEAIGLRTAPVEHGASVSVPYELGIRVDRAITIDRPRAEVFSFFHEFRNLPRFMEHVQSVSEIDGNRSHWVVKAPAGRTVEWDAVIHNEIENEIIAWRSLPGSDVDHAGSVQFKDAPGNRGTEVRVEMQYNPPAGVMGAMVAKLFGEEPTQQFEEDLHRLKQILEAGEILTTSGQPSGAKSRIRAGETASKEWEVQEASEASFPASDAPAYTR